MAELVPIPLDLLLRRAFLECEREGKIFDLAPDKFFRGQAGLDTSVTTNGHRAFTPLGPAAGPHDQLAQNIVLCWLGGARIIELKTVQVLDELKIPRPCIDAENVTYNVEWSQELKLEQSLREYISAAMFLAIVKESRLLGDGFPAGFYDTVLDMSVGYNLEGIQSPRVRAWIQGMKDATRTIDELRSTLTGRFRKFRDLPFDGCVSDTMTLSTFHGCPAEEIEGIVTFLLKDMGVHVCVKMNPTLLGKEQVGHLLHDVMGYREIVLSDEAFQKDMQFDQAVDLIPRLQKVADSCGRRLSVKFSNTLVVKNHRQVFRDELMYMSGPPLHVLTLNLVRKFRERMGTTVPISFSAGLTANNMANTVAMNFVPVTTCTDLLRPAGYGRLHKYLVNLGARMRETGATTVPEFIVRHAGQGDSAIENAVQELRKSLRQMTTNGDGSAANAASAWLDAIPAQLREWLKKPNASLRSTCEQLAQDAKHALRSFPEHVVAKVTAKIDGLEQLLVDHAGLLNTPILVEQATVDPRYRWEQNRAVPRKIGSKLWLYDCLTCDKCVPVCPNDANFTYEIPPVEIPYHNYALLPGGKFEAVEGGVFRVKKREQFANYADACNECANCSVACPEDGGPFVEKPRFFGSLETYRQHAGKNGFYIEFGKTAKTIYGTIAGKSYRLACDLNGDQDHFQDDNNEYTIRASCNALVSWRAQDSHGAGTTRFDLLPYLHLKFLLDAVSDPRHVNYANVAGLGS